MQAETTHMGNHQSTQFNSIMDEIGCFEPISLGEMDRVALLKRTDTKFILHERDLAEVLKLVNTEYRVLEIEGNRFMTYNSLYFDTPDKYFYTEHHNGRANRIKVRIREYVESARYYLEIKKKDSKGNTNKSRIKIPEFETDLSPASLEFIKKTVHKDFELTPAIRTDFNRFTLVNNVDKERVTIDLNLEFNIKDSLEYTGNSVDDAPYKGLVIVEVKQERFDRRSPVVCALKRYRIHPYSLSKYCIGMLCHYKDLKQNAFKRKLLKIKKVGAQ